MQRYLLWELLLLLTCSTKLCDNDRFFWVRTEYILLSFLFLYKYFYLVSKYSYLIVNILPDTTKSIFVVSPWNVPQAEAFFMGYGLQIVTGSCYIGGFVGPKAAQDCCLGDKLKIWRDSVVTLAGVVRQHL